MGFFQWGLQTLEEIRDIRESLFAHSVYEVSVNVSSCTISIRWSSAVMRLDTLWPSSSCCIHRHFPISWLCPPTGNVFLWTSSSCCIHRHLPVSWLCPPTGNVFVSNTFPATHPLTFISFCIHKDIFQSLGFVASPDSLPLHTLPLAQHLTRSCVFLYGLCIQHGGRIQDYGSRGKRIALMRHLACPTRRPNGRLLTCDKIDKSAVW